MTQVQEVRVASIRSRLRLNLLDDESLHEAQQCVAAAEEFGEELEGGYQSAAVG